VFIIDLLKGRDIGTCHVRLLVMHDIFVIGTCFPFLLCVCPGTPSIHTYKTERKGPLWLGTSLINGKADIWFGKNTVLIRYCTSGLVTWFIACMIFYTNNYGFTRLGSVEPSVPSLQESRGPRKYFPWVKICFVWKSIPSSPQSVRGRDFMIHSLFSIATL